MINSFNPRVEVVSTGPISEELALEYAIDGALDKGYFGGNFSLELDGYIFYEDEICYYYTVHKINKLDINNLIYGVWNER